MRAGKLAGIQLILNNWFLALLALFTLAGMGGKVAGVFAAVLWHELAHAAVAARLGYQVREIELLPFGGVARIDRISEAGSTSELLMAAAGPAASLVMAAVIFLGMLKYPGWARELDFFLKVNLMLALFNLLPGLPLDGGRILRAWLTVGLGYGKATAVVARVGKILAGGLVLATFGEVWQTGTFNLTFIIAAVFLYLAAGAEMKVAGFRTMRVLAQKKARLTAEGIMPTLHYTALAGTRAREVVRRFGPEQYYVVLVVDETCRLKGMLTETEVWEGLPERGFYAKIGEFL